MSIYSISASPLTSRGQVPQSASSGKSVNEKSKNCNPQQQLNSYPSYKFESPPDVHMFVTRFGGIAKKIYQVTEEACEMHSSSERHTPQTLKDKGDRGEVLIIKVPLDQTIFPDIGEKLRALKGILSSRNMIFKNSNTVNLQDHLARSSSFPVFMQDDVVYLQPSLMKYVKAEDIFNHALNLDNPAVISLDSRRSNVTPYPEEKVEFVESSIPGMLYPPTIQDGFKRK